MKNKIVPTLALLLSFGALAQSGPLPTTSGKTAAGGAIAGAGTAPQAAYYSAANVISSTSALQFQATEVVVNETGSSTMDFRVEGDADANLLFADASTDSVGVGTNAPVVKFEIRRDFNGATQAAITNRTSGTSAGTYLYIATDDLTSQYYSLSSTSAGHTASGLSLPLQGRLFSEFGNTNGVLIGTNFGTAPIVFSVPTTTGQIYLAGSERMRITNTVVTTSAEAVVAPPAGHAGTALTVTGGTLAASGTANSLLVTGTHSSTPGIGILRVDATGTSANTYSHGGAIFLTTAGSGAAAQQTAFVAVAQAGYTGAYLTEAIEGANLVAGTGTNPVDTAGLANFGVLGKAIATTTGTNVGTYGGAYGGNINIGLLGFSGVVTVSDKANATNVGVYGSGLNGSVTSPISVGGYFTLRTSTLPTFVTAALIADNDTQASPIFIARDGGTPAFTIADGGAITHTQTLTTLRVSQSGTQSVACAAGVLALTPTAPLVLLDANGAACAVTLAEPAAGFLNDDIQIIVVTSAGAGAVTFPNVAGIHAGPTLCTTTGVPLNSSYTVTYANMADDKLVGKSCSTN